MIYDGPDTEHLGKEICLASNEDTLTIVDVTDKSAPVMLSRTGYPDSGYVYQGCLTEGAFIDTVPGNDGTSFGGAWSTYPYFSSGVVLISDISRGLFIVRPEGLVDGMVFTDGFESGDAANWSPPEPRPRVRSGRPVVVRARSLWRPPPRLPAIR